VDEGFCIALNLFKSIIWCHNFCFSGWKLFFYVLFVIIPFSRFISNVAQLMVQWQPSDPEIVQLLLIFDDITVGAPVNVLHQRCGFVLVANILKNNRRYKPGL